MMARFLKSALLGLISVSSGVALAQDSNSAFDSEFVFDPARYRGDLGDTSVTSVAVAGSFNAWNTSSHLLTKSGDVFRRTLRLPEGRHEYKIVVNGNLWLSDKEANFHLTHTLKESPHGNSVVAAFDFGGASPPTWSQGAIWYQIFPERFANGDPSNDPTVESIKMGEIDGWKIRDWGSDWYSLDPWERTNYPSFHKSVYSRRYGGDLQGIIDRLDYIQYLGITAIYLNPVFRSPSLHKYDGSSFHHIEETFGPDPEGDRRLLAEANETEDPATWVWTKADLMFLELVREIHRRGMRVIIDGVFNHSGRHFFAFQDLLRNGQQSRYADWYKILRWDPSLPDGFEYQGWYGVKSLPEFRQTDSSVDPDYFRYVKAITKRWLAPRGKSEDGVDGFRLDVAFMLPHAFWREWRQVVKAIKSDAYITAEYVEPAPEVLKGDIFDGLMNYPFAFTLSEFFIDRDKKISLQDFQRRMRQLYEMYGDKTPFAMQNLISSHDTPRARSLVANPDLGYRDWADHFYASKVENNPNYVTSRGDEKDLRTHMLMALMQMTWPGSPMIYYGDEVGMSGANDPDCRKPMVWNDIVYADERVMGSDGTMIMEPNQVERGLHSLYRQLIRLRRSSPALTRGNVTFLSTGSSQVLVFERRYENEAMRVLVNPTTSKQTVRLSEGREFLLSPRSGRIYSASVAATPRLMLATP